MTMPPDVAKWMRQFRMQCVSRHDHRWDEYTQSLICRTCGHTIDAREILLRRG